jgi:hypothetical protein
MLATSLKNQISKQGPPINPYYKTKFMTDRSQADGPASPSGKPKAS